MVEFIRNREELTQQLVLLCKEGWSIRALARHFAISRNTVRRALRAHQMRRDQGHDPVLAARVERRGSKLDVFEEQIRQLLEKYPRITGQRVFEELVAAGYTGAISILRARLRHIRPQPKREPVIRFETEPGLQGQMDWSPYTLSYTTGVRQKVQCFSYILGFSRRQFIDFTLRRDFFTLIRRHLDAFAHFQGVPAQCLYDSEKTVVLRWEAGRPLINPAFAALATHYCFRPDHLPSGTAGNQGQDRAAVSICRREPPLRPGVSRS